MNRLEYLTKLRQCLEEGGLAKFELEDALRFYEEIFLDAGVEHESETSENLGSPEELARKILLDNDIHADGNPVFQMDEAINPEQQAQYKAQQNQNGNSLSVLAKVLILAITFPIWFPVVCTVGALAFAFVVTALALIFAFFAAGIGLLVGGVVSIIYVPPVGLIMLGSGIILMSLCGLIFAPFFKWLWRLCVKFFNWIISAIRKILGVGRVNING